jgi:hypothetical protein
MAITVTPRITGQIIDGQRRYRYLFEPLEVKIIEPGSEQFYIEIQKKNYTGGIISTYSDYVTGELNASGTVAIDLMKVARDFLSDNIYQIGIPSDISTGTIVPFYLTYSVTTDVTSTPVTLDIIPIIGGRTYDQFEANVTNANALTEFEYLGVALPDFIGYPKISQSLANATSSNIEPTLNISTANSGATACGGFLIWKSRFGGWAYWGFDIISETPKTSFNETIEQGLFDVNTNGNPIINANYTGINESYTVSLKALGLKNDYAKVLRGMSSAPVAYLMRGTTSKMELMRVTSVSAPVTNLTDGVDVEISLSSISNSFQNVR